MSPEPGSSWVNGGADQGAPRRRRGAVKIAVGVAAVYLVAGALWWGAPRSSEVEVEAPIVCSYPRPDGFDRVALVSCSKDGVMGVLNRSQTLISTDWNLGSYNDTAVAYIQTDSEQGTLRITRPWFGSKSYVFVAEDGT